MHYNYYFDICAIFILSTIAITSLSRRFVPAYRQKAFGCLLFAIFAATIFERIETYLQMHPMETAWYPLAEKLVGSCYFIAHLASAAAYFMYIMAVLDIYVSYKEVKSFVMVFFAFFTGLLLVLINWFYPILFHYDASGIYHRDNFIYIYYVLAFYYLFGSIYLMVRFNNLMRVKTRLIITSYAMIVIFGIIIQFVFPTLLIENFCNAISTTLVYITLQNPSEMVDESLNILNRKAFIDSLNLSIKRKSTHYTIFVTIDNIRALSSEIGYAQSQNVLKNIARYLKRSGMKEYGLQTYAYRYGEYIFAVTVHCKDEEMVRNIMDKISDRLKEAWNSLGMAIKVEGHLFMMCYPRDFGTASELMGKIDLIYEDITDNPDMIIDIKESLFGESKRSKDFDMLARENLDSKTAVIKYQPVLSKIYKLNYCVDVVAYFYDENGNEIDMRKHVPDVRVTQSLMDTDEFVYRRAARALSFWNAGNKHGKYRAIVGLSQGEISKNDFIRRIKKILREERAEASWINIKLTETTLTTMNNIAERNIKLMGELGSYVIVDKFGSGYGDLHRILSLPVQQVNIDISVLREAARSEQMRLVTQGIVNLFHDVSIFVGASEISTEEDKRIAEELECDYLIGDYMCKPTADSSFVKHIDAYFEEG